MLQHHEDFEVENVESSESDHNQYYIGESEAVVSDDFGASHDIVITDNVVVNADARQSSDDTTTA